MKENELR